VKRKERIPACHQSKKKKTATSKNAGQRIKNYKVTKENTSGKPEMGNGGGRQAFGKEGKGVTTRAMYTRKITGIKRKDKDREKSPQKPMGKKDRKKNRGKLNLHREMKPKASRTKWGSEGATDKKCAENGPLTPKESGETTEEGDTQINNRGGRPHRGWFILPERKTNHSETAGAEKKWKKKSSNAVEKDEALEKEKFKSEGEKKHGPMLLE